MILSLKVRRMSMLIYLMSGDILLPGSFILYNRNQLHLIILPKFINEALHQVRAKLLDATKKAILSQTLQEITEVKLQRVVKKRTSKLEVYVYVIPPFGVVLPVYPPDYPRARSARGGRADKPQHHDKRWNKMFITVDWSLLGNLRAREGGAVKFFQKYGKRLLHPHA